MWTDVPWQAMKYSRLLHRDLSMEPGEVSGNLLKSCRAPRSEAVRYLCVTVWVKVVFLF